MFGSGCDLYISNFTNTQSSGSRLDVAYQLPPGQPNTFFTGATFFTVTDYEVFGLQQWQNTSRKGSCGCAHILCIIAHSSLWRTGIWIVDYALDWPRLKTVQYSLVYRFRFVSRRLLARAARAVHHLFYDLSTSSGLSTKTKRFGYFAIILSQEHLLFLRTWGNIRGNLLG